MELRPDMDKQSHVNNGLNTELPADAQVFLQGIRQELANDPETKKALEKQLGVSLMECMYLCELLGTTLEKFTQEHPMEEFEESFIAMKNGFSDDECDDAACNDCCAAEKSK